MPRLINLLALATTGLLFSAPSTVRAQDVSTSPPYPPPGRLIDMGGWRLHINCTGEAHSAQPTVVLEAGAGDFSVDWSLVQPRVAGFARVCSYDRAGSGWSELGPRPRTLHQLVWELHTLLGKAGVGPPYVLVGHSFGGILVRLYVCMYPSEVAGIVFDDSGYENGVAVLMNGKIVRLVDTATGKPVPPVKTSDPIHESDIPPDILSQLQNAARWGAAHANGPPRDKLPIEAQRMRAWSVSQVKHYAANDNPFAGEELAAMLAEQKKQEHPLGDKPLTVLSRGLPEYENPKDRGVEDEHNRNQAELVKLSRNGKQVLALHSHHHILMEEPELVVTSIREVLDLARKRGLAAFAAPPPMSPTKGSKTER